MRGAVLAAILMLASPAHADIWPSSHQRVAEALSEGDVTERRAAAAKLPSLPPKLARSLALEALHDADIEVRLLAAHAAAGLGVEEAGDEVVGWLQERDARLRVAAAELIDASPTPNAVQALARVLGDAQADVRRAAAAAMGSSGLPGVVSPLLGHLDDTSPEVRLEVVRALGRVGDSRAVVPLVSRLQDQEEEVRREAARALGRLGDPRATTTLMLALQDKSRSVRVQALQALGALGAEQATAAIGALVTGRGGEVAEGAVREAALEALGRIASVEAVEALVAELAREGPVPLAERAPTRSALVLAGEPAIEALVKVLRGSPTQRVASAAALALGALGAAEALQVIEQATRRGTISLTAGLRSLAALGDDEALPFVLEHLDDGDGRARRVAVEVAATLLKPAQRDGRAVDVVRNRVTSLSTPLGERIALARLLGQTGSPRAAALLLPLAKQKPLALRVTALEALGRLGVGGDDSVESLLEALADDDLRVRKTAASALARVGGNAAAKELLRRLSESAEQDRAAIGIALSGVLGRSDDPSLVRGVKKSLAAAPPGARDALIEGLGRMGIAEAGELLAKLRRTPDADDRRKIAEALASHEAQGETLVELVEDPDPAVRANAAWALGKVGKDDAALSALSRRLSDSDVAVAGNAAAGLAKVAVRTKARKRANKALCTALDDYRSYVRAGALSGLRLLGGRCDGQARTVLLRDRNWRVRAAAARLLQASGGGEDDRRVLWRCSVEDRDATVASVCRSAPEQSQGRDDVLVYVVPHGKTRATARAPFALVLPDGTMRLGVADRRGALFEKNAPAGKIELAVPAALAR